MSKSLRWALAISLLAVIGSGLVIAFMLSLTSELDLFERNFVWLFWVNLAVAAALLLVILIAATRLWLRLRSGKFGSKLLIKLAGIFALVGVVPGVLIYTCRCSSCRAASKPGSTRRWPARSTRAWRSAAARSRR